jgi:hypothetical protein
VPAPSHHDREDFWLPEDFRAIWHRKVFAEPKVFAIMKAAAPKDLATQVL